MSIESYIPVIPSKDLQESLKFWCDGLGFKMQPHSYDNEILTGCMLTKDNLCFMLNIRYGLAQRPENYEGVRFYWSPTDLEKLRAELLALNFDPSAVTERNYGQSEFFLTDADF